MLDTNMRPVCASTQSDQHLCCYQGIFYVFGGGGGGGGGEVWKKYSPNAKIWKSLDKNKEQNLSPKSM